MTINVEEIQNKSYSTIKEFCDNKVSEYGYKHEYILKLIDILMEDKRKNVNALGAKYKKKLEALNAEINRVRNMYEFDKSFGSYKYVAGVDEVGRGPLAGPIVACAVILDLSVIDDELILYINDSKKLTEAKRSELAKILKEKAVSYSVQECSNNEIDELGIGFCNNKVFLESCNNLKMKPEMVLSDGYLIKGIEIPNKSIIKGDTKSASIAAASIIAKDYRDTLMKEYAKVYPEYDFEDNMGYGTKKHIEALKDKGITDIHRKSFLTKLL